MKWEKWGWGWEWDRDPQSVTFCLTVELLMPCDKQILNLCRTWSSNPCRAHWVVRVSTKVSFTGKETPSFTVSYLQVSTSLQIKKPRPWLSHAETTVYLPNEIRGYNYVMPANLHSFNNIQYLPTVFHLLTMRSKSTNPTMAQFWETHHLAHNRWSTSNKQTHICTYTVCE